MKRATRQLVVTLALLALLGAVAPMTAQGDDAQLASGGIGLSRAAWEADHGPGAGCCTAGTGEGGRPYQVLSYEDGAFYVGLASNDFGENAVVTFVEWGWGVGETPLLEDLVAMLPVDAALVETYGLPNTPDGPIAITVYRFESQMLAAEMSNMDRESSGSIVALYQEEPKASQGRVSISVGTRS